jgi:hypothetical protein
LSVGRALLACFLLRLLERADQASMDELQAGMVEARDVLLSHKYAKPLHVDITIQPAGEGFIP